MKEFWKIFLEQKLILKSKLKKFKGFVITDTRRNGDFFCDYPVTQVDSLERSENLLIIIGTSLEYRDEISQNLRDRGFTNIYIPKSAAANT